MNYLDRVKFATATTGTDTLTIGSASAGFRTPAQAGAVDGRVYRYKIEDTGNAWEIGYGTYTSSGTTLSRTVTSSSNSDNAINLSGSAVVAFIAAAADIGWQQVVNESGASFANFTAASGTWSSDGTVIKQTDTAATSRRAKYNTMIITSMVIVQADIQIKSSGAVRQGGILIGFDGSGANGLVVRLDEGANTLGVDTEGVDQRLNISTTIAVDTWYTVNIVFSGGWASVYLDGTLMGTSGYVAQQSYNASFIGLYTFQAEVWFRNVQAWNLPLPR